MSSKWGGVASLIRITQRLAMTAVAPRLKRDDELALAA
jgi:hypothetical protein